MNARTSVAPRTDRLAWELRQNMSLQRVAAELDRRGVPSPTGLGWHASAVRRAVARHEARRP